MNTKEREIAHNTQEKFEFYVISLVFTLLALSIQTYKFGQSNLADTFELVGWACLLLSGIAGLWRLEYLPVTRIKYIMRSEYEEKILELQKLEMQGQAELLVVETNSTQPISQRIQIFQQAVDALDPVIRSLERGNLRKYAVHRYSFVFALVCLLVSHSYLPVAQLVQGWLR